MILANVLLHVSVYEGVYTLLLRHTHTVLRLCGRWWRLVTLAGVVLLVFACHVVSIWGWAALLLLLHIPVLNALEPALYFATVSYTTIGYGDIVLDENWRLLAAFAGANGLILFGWSTAFLYEVISKLHRADNIRP